MRRFSKITTTQLARICGVSQGTVDRALHNRGGISPQTKEHILSVAKEYGYFPSIQCGEQKNSMLIGVVLFDLYNEFFSKLAMGIVHVAREHGYSIIFQFSGKDHKTEKEALEYFDYIGVDGIILFSVGSDSEEYRNYLYSLKRPLVLIGNRMFDLPFVGIDDTRAMRELTEEFVKQPFCGDLLYYAPILTEHLHTTNAQRLRLVGFEDAMKAIGKRYRIVTELNELLNFGGIVCSTDYYALKVLKHFGYSKEIRLAGFDHISTLKELNIRILTVEYSTEQIAENCIQYLLGRHYEAIVPHRILLSGN